MVCSTFLACCPWDLSHPVLQIELVLEPFHFTRTRQRICEFFLHRALHNSRGEHSIQTATTLLGIRVLRASRHVAALVESMASHDAPSGDELAGAGPGQLRGHPAPEGETNSVPFHSGLAAAATVAGLPAFLFYGARSKRPAHLLQRQTFLTPKQEEGIRRNYCDCTGCAVLRIALGQACLLHSSNPVARGQCGWCELHRDSALIVALESFLRKSGLIHVRPRAFVGGLDTLPQLASCGTPSVPGSIHEGTPSNSQCACGHSKLQVPANVEGAGGSVANTKIP